MTVKEKEEVIKMPALAYWTDFGGIEVKDIQYGTEDYLTCVSLVTTDHPRVHYLKIKTSMGGRPYVIIYGHNMYLDQCLKV